MSVLSRLFPVEPGQYIPEESEDWAKARLGRITASDRAGRIMSDPQANAVIAEITHELETGKPFREFAGNWATRHGNDHEERALFEYDMARVTPGELVHKPGFTVHPDCPLLGASPDFLVGADTVGQVKCPGKPQNHLNHVYNGPGKYMSQIQTESLVTGRPIIVFVSYDPRVAPVQQLHSEVIEANVVYQQRLLERVMLIADMIEKGSRFGAGKLSVERGVPKLF